MKNNSRRSSRLFSQV